MWIRIAREYGDFDCCTLELVGAAYAGAASNYSH
jgi:hypothetical protein